MPLKLVAMGASLKVRTNDFRLWLGIGLSALLSIIFLLSIIAYIQFAQIEDPFSQLDRKFLAFISAYTVLETTLILKLGIGCFGKLSLRDIGWRTDNWKSDCSVGLLGAATAVFTVFMLGAVFGQWNWSRFAEAQSEFTLSQRVLFLLVGLNAGFIEESLFRGFLQPAVIKKIGLFWGIVLTSVIFSAYHLKFQPQVFIGKFILGLIFGALRMRDKSLWRSGIAHALMWVATGSL